MGSIRAAADDLFGTRSSRRLNHLRMRSQRVERRPIYTIDSRDRLVAANRAFIDTLPRKVVQDETELIGRSIWDFIAGVIPQQIWRVLYGRARSFGAPMFVPLRSDDANHRRVIDVELHPAGDRSVRHVRECVSVERRIAVALLDPNYPRDERELKQCAFCARIEVKFGTWQEVEHAYVSLHLNVALTLPRLREAACESCKQSLLKTFPVRVA